MRFRYGYLNYLLGEVYHAVGPERRLTTFH
jgi:hypothetical protein